jgi:hypothetical protein
MHNWPRMMSSRALSRVSTSKPVLQARTNWRDGAFRSLLIRRAGGKGSHGVRDSLRQARHVGDVPQGRVAWHRAAEAQENMLKATLEQRHDLRSNFADLSLLEFKKDQLLPHPEQ